MLKADMPPSRRQLSSSPLPSPSPLLQQSPPPSPSPPLSPPSSSPTSTSADTAADVTAAGDHRPDSASTIVPLTCCRSHRSQCPVHRKALSTPLQQQCAATLTTLHPHSPSEVPSPTIFAVHHRRQMPLPAVSPPLPPLPSPRFDCCICTSPPPRRRHPTQLPPPLNAPTHHCLCEPSQFSTTAASLSSAAAVEIHLCRHRLAVAMLLSIAVSIKPVQMPPPPLKGFAHCGRWKVAASGGRGWR